MKRIVRMSPSDFEALRAKAVAISIGGRPAGMAETINIKVDRPPDLRVAPYRTTVTRPTFPSRHKYHAQRTEADGVKFASKSEAARYHYLQAERAAGRLIFFLMQTRIDIPGSTYRLDFLEFWADGRIVWLDVKGFETEAFKIKRRAIEAIYPFKITTARQRGRGDNKTWEYA